MKLNVLVFSFFLLPLYYHCNNTNTSPDNRERARQTDSNIKTAGALANKQAADTANKNPFGILIAKTNDRAIDINRQIKIAKALGVQYMRAHAYMNNWNGTINNYQQLADAGFKIILNINYAVPRDDEGNKNPVPFPKDMQAYSKTLTAILDKYKPELTVIENEEDNPGYHSGDADDYINELKTAINICHAKGLKVTNGGLTVREMNLLVYDELVRNGKKQQANDFAKRAFAPVFLNRLNNYQNIPLVQRQITFGRKVIQAYKTLDLDYINFHWYEPVSARGAVNSASIKNEHIDPLVFTGVVNYLTRLTGKPVITNEFGVMNASATLIQELMQRILDAQMDYAIFYSGDGAGGAQALQNADASLRQTGIAMRDFIQQHCK